MIKQYLIKTFVLCSISIISITQTSYAQRDTLWTRTIGGSGDEFSYSVQQTSDGGYIVVGTSGSFSEGEENIYLIKTDANGNDLWTKEIQVRDYSEGKSVQQTSDGGYIITGNSRWSTSLSDMVLIKTDASGNVIWTKTFGGSSRYDDGRCVQQTTDGGYIIAGRTDTYGQLTDVYLVKTDASGNLEWQQVNNGSGHEDGNYVEQTSDGGFIVVGYTLRIGTSSDDVYLI